MYHEHSSYKDLSFKTSGQWFFNEKPLTKVLYMTVVKRFKWEVVKLEWFYDPNCESPNHIMRVGSLCMAFVQYGSIWVNEMQWREVSLDFYSKNQKFPNVQIRLESIHHLAITSARYIHSSHVKELSNKTLKKIVL